MGYGEIYFAVLVTLVIMLIAVVLMFAVALIEAKVEIAKYNKAAIESCIVMSCDVTFMGDLKCSTIDIRDNVNASSGYIILVPKK